LLLRLSTARSDGIGYAEHGRKHFERDATVENPQRKSNQCAEEGKQALNWGLLKGQHNPGYAGNKSGQEVYRVQKFQHPRSGVSAEGKVH